MLVLLSFFNLNAEISKPTQFIEQDFDVLKYSCRLDIRNAPLETLSAKNDIKFVWTNGKPDAEMYFHLRDLIVDSILYNGNRISIEQKFDVLNDEFYYVVERNSAFDNDTNIVTVFYHGLMKSADGEEGWGGVSLYNDILYSMGVAFKAKYVSSTRFWLACYDHPSDKAEYEADIIVPAGLGLASTGAWTVDNLDNGTDIYHFRHKFPVATYLLTFVAGNFIRQDNNYKGLPIEVFCKSADSASARYYFKLVPKMLETFENYFGKYPFEKVGYALTPTGSMEHQTMICLLDNLVRKSISRKDSLATTAAHELAHQWFGNMITPFDFRDAWLNESFATYCESLWQTSVLGEDRYIKKLSEDWQVYQSIANDEGLPSLYDFHRDGNSSNYPATIYYKGSTVLGLLRYQIGDTAFFRSIRRYADENRYGNVDTKILFDILQNESTKDLTEFFEQWIFSNGHPVLEITYDSDLSQGADSVRLHIKQVQHDSLPTFVDFPIELAFLGEDGKYFHRLINISERNQIVTLYDIQPAYAITAYQPKTVRSPALVKFITYTGNEVNETLMQKSQIFPNPTNQLAVLNITLAKDGRISVEMVDLLGNSSRIVNEVYLPEGKSSLSLDLSAFEIGSYTLRIIRENGEVENCRLIIGD